jgi:hypothetical protein
MLPSLKNDKDGSLRICIPKKSPGRYRKSTWLPAPDEPIYLDMLLHCPKTTPPSILPPGEGTW